MDRNRPIGVFDSGMGGISVLKSLVRILPDEHFIYLGDNINAPYGVKDKETIRFLTEKIVYRLLDMGCKAIVIACNTATSAAAAYLRQSLSIPVLGLEPALKPASVYANGGRIAVLATKATLDLPKYRDLAERYGANAVDIPCPRFVEFVEKGDTSSDELKNYIIERLSEAGDIKAIVLGCTHFVFLKDTIHSLMPDIALFDGNDGVARHLRNTLSVCSLLNDKKGGGYELHTTSHDPAISDIMRRYMVTE